MAREVMPRCCGQEQHRHLDPYRLVFDDQEELISAMLVALPIEPRFSQFPALRLYSYDTDTAEILDYAQYQFDLKRANAEMDSKNSDKYWRLDYLFQERYNLPNLSRQSLATILARTRESASDNLHRSMEGRKINTDSRRQQNGSNRSKILWSSCAIANIELASFQECISAADDATSVPSPPSIVSVAFSGLFSFYLFYR